MTETGMGPETPATTTRSTRRTRRLAIIGAVALVVVAGAVLVGVKTTGARGGYTAGVSCQMGGACALGDTGPGGGKVFYVATNQFTCGVTLMAKCLYLEAAPAGWNPSYATDPKGLWCSSNHVASTAGTYSTAIGTGLYHTNAMVTTNQCSSGAGFLAANYRGGNLSDWALPSEYEANELYTQKSVSGVNQQTGAIYWTSTEVSADNAVVKYMYCYQVTICGSSPNVYKTYSYLIRPVRAF